MWVSSIYPSSLKKVEFTSLNGYRWDNFESMVYVSEDYGLNWSRIGNELPKEPVNVIIEDNINEGLVYVGTDHGVYASLDYGNNFHPFIDGLSGAPVHDLVIHPRDNDLVVGTHGRSVYIADMTYLQKIDQNILSKELHVFKVDNLKYSNRWGTTNWYGNLIEPSIEIVMFSKSKIDIEILIEGDNGESITHNHSLDLGLNFINHNLLISDENKYLSKGKYILKVTNLEENYITEFEIN